MEVESFSERKRRMAFNKRFMAGLAAVAVLGVALSGCGGDTADGGSGGGDSRGSLAVRFRLSGRAER